MRGAFCFGMKPLAACIKAMGTSISGCKKEEDEAVQNGSFTLVVHGKDAPKGAQGRGNRHHAGQCQCCNPRGETDDDENAPNDFTSASKANAREDLNAVFGRVRERKFEVFRCAVRKEKQAN
jgi:hypothetical protein